VPEGTIKAEEQPVYDLAGLEAALTGTSFAGKLHFARVTGSTNSDALAAARNAAPHGSVYFADEQLTGRGRGHHGWISSAGEGLYASVLLRPQFSAARLPFLPLAAGLAAAAAIRAVSGLAVDLRWPNDLLLGPRKAGGILVESQTASAQHEIARAGSVAFAVVGIGINVHQRVFPPGLASPPTSLDQESGKRISRQALLVALLQSLEREALALANAEAANEIPARAEQASTWARGRSVQVHGPQSCTGVTAGLDENGFLRVETADGLITVRTGGLRERPASSP
jgi:BirA family biotin operon repressor/biotin-[acetyl-CoA-carboxylase] ligase